jgi:FAD/FMN-containing dehydrogenase
MVLGSEGRLGILTEASVRVTPLPAGSRVDVRSVSRVGRSDIGTNAERIRAYFARVAAPGSP